MKKKKEKNCEFECTKCAKSFEMKGKHMSFTKCPQCLKKESKKRTRDSRRQKNERRINRAALGELFDTDNERCISAEIAESVADFIRRHRRVTWGMVFKSIPNPYANAGSMASAMRKVGLSNPRGRTFEREVSL
jgi:hypothetical protein